MDQEILYLTPSGEHKIFTTFCFYNDLLPALREHYKKSTNPPIISLELIDRIEPLVLPVFLGLGYYLKTFHKKPIDLKLDYNPRLLYYLQQSHFFKTSTKRENDAIGLDIFNFDEKYIAGDLLPIIEKEQRPEHKVHYYFPVVSNNQYSHDLLYENLTLITLVDHFGTVLSDIIPEDKISECIQSIAEPISNGILHSKSITFAISQTTTSPFSKTQISIADVGIGFKKSLQDNKIPTLFIDSLKNTEKYNAALEDFYYIIEALFYSTTKNRCGLADFVFAVSEQGTVRIHYNSTQVIFTPRIINKVTELKECREKIKSEYRSTKTISEKTLHLTISAFSKLAKVIIQLYSTDIRFSPIRFYSINFTGVHIEFEILH